jgi:hypothetical protein
VVAINRNAWSQSIVTAGRDHPVRAVVLSVDEKSQIQALDRTQPGLPMKPGRAGTMSSWAHSKKL